MTPPHVNPLIGISCRRVLVIVEDATLAELLDEALEDAGHMPEHVDDRSHMLAALANDTFDAAIVDVDNRAHDGAELVDLLRHAAPGLTVIALLPCGGLPAGARSIAYHLAIEKPARLHAVLSAVAVAKSNSHN